MTLNNEEPVAFGYESNLSVISVDGVLFLSVTPEEYLFAQQYAKQYDCVMKVLLEPNLQLVFIDIPFWKSIMSKLHEDGYESAGEVCDKLDKISADFNEGKKQFLEETAH